jgi:hypothetical protein
MASDKDMFVTALRNEATAFWDSYQNLLALTDEFTARGWSGQIAAPDISDQNYDVTPQIVSDLIGTITAVDALMDSGHKTNLALSLKRSA